MTEFWVSKARYWCKYCKCWMSDTKAARFKHEQGERHKSAVLAWMKENRQKKKDEAREKEELAREMAMIDKAARGQFSQDVAQGLASYNRPAGAGGSWYGFAPGHSGAPAGTGPPGGPPPPPPRPGGGGDQSHAPPPPPAKKIVDKALADELAKEGIILEADGDDDTSAGAGEGAAAAEAGSAAAAAAAAVEELRAQQPVLWWQYKPLAAVKTEGADGAKAAPSAEQGASGSAGEKQDRNDEEEEKPYGPFNSQQMAAWARDGYFNTGPGACVRKCDPTGQYILSEWQSTLELDSHELLTLFTGVEGGGVYSMQAAEAEAAQAAQEAADAAEAEAQGVKGVAHMPGQWETVKVVNVAQEKQVNEQKHKQMQSRQKHHYARGGNDSDDEDDISSAVWGRDGKRGGEKHDESVFAQEEEEEEEKDVEVAKPGSVVFKTGKRKETATGEAQAVGGSKAGGSKGGGAARKFRRKTGGNDDD